MEVKEIKLSKYEKTWILLCKGQLQDKYPFKGEWTETLKAPFEDIYGYSPEEHYDDYLRCMFNKLLDIHMKIKDDKSGTDRELKEVFYASFGKWLHISQDKPIERAIAALCGLIQCTTYMEDGVKRYDLEIEEPIK